MTHSPPGVMVEGVMLNTQQPCDISVFKSAGKINKSNQGDSCAHPTSRWLTRGWIYLLRCFWGQFLLDPRCTQVYRNLSVVPVLLLPIVLLTSTQCVNISAVCGKIICMNTKHIRLYCVSEPAAKNYSILPLENLTKHWSPSCIDPPERHGFQYFFKGFPQTVLDTFCCFENTRS